MSQIICVFKVIGKDSGYKRKDIIVIIVMNESITHFCESLSQQHYSSAFVQHLVDTIAGNNQITTLQEIYELIQKESDIIIAHFTTQTADNKLIQYRSPLCFESLRHYFHTMTRGVYKKYGSDINKFKEGLRTIAQRLIEILASSTKRIVEHSQTILKDGTGKKILVYSYSKSICLSLKRLSKSLQENLLVYVCKSGSLQEGIKLYEELVLDGVRCQLINDNEVGFYMHQMTCVVIGAEVILENGAILNRAGTSMISLIAHHARKPVYVFAESYKFLRKIYLSQGDIPQRFRQDKQKQVKTISVDLTPPEHITLFCTDNGLISPEIISLELSKLLQ